MSTNIQEPHTFNGMSLHVSITVAPEDSDKFLAAFKPCFDAVTAEPECTFFQVYQDPDTPGRFKWVENWSKDKEWFFKHQMTKDYYKPYLEITEPLFVKPREFEFVDRMPSGWTVVKGEDTKH